MEGQQLDIICYSRELKKLVRDKLAGQGMSLVEICKLLNLVYKDVQVWLYEEPKQYNGYTQLQVIKLAEHLGIKITITFAVDESHK